MLGLPERTDAAEKAYFSRLQKELDRYKLMTDEMFHIDVHKMLDDHRYFPFEEVLESVVATFSRDPYILKHVQCPVHKPIVTNSSSSSSSINVPPCGVFPFRGFVNYAAPICFMYEAVEPVYFVVRAMFCKVWCRLNCISSQENGVLFLFKTFEDLLQAAHPRLYFHLLNLGTHPLQIGMCRAGKKWFEIFWFLFFFFFFFFLFR